MKKMVLGAMILLFTATTFAQTKVGTVDADFILSKMPELAAANEEVKKYNLDLESQLKAKLESYDAKITAYNAAVGTMTDDVKKTKQQEVISLEDEISKFRQNGAQLLQLKQNEVVQPLYKKIGEFVTAISQEKGYTHILTIGNNNNLAFADPEHDITMDVITKMGIKLDEEGN